MSRPREEELARGELLRVTNASKTFGNVRVLTTANLSLEHGEVHGLLGQNGSGKSTLVKILSGYHAPDEGAELTVRGQAVKLPIRGGRSSDLGIAFVHQDLALIDRASVVENVCMPRWQRRPALGAIPWRGERRWARDAMQEFGVDLDVDTPVGGLRQGIRAVLAIVRALAVADSTREPILIMDEPTASLPKQEVELLFDAIHRITARGGGILFVSHRLDEVRTICDRMTVLRDGRVVGSGEPSALSEGELIKLIVGKDLDEGENNPPEGGKNLRQVVLDVESLSGEIVDKINFTLREGEILGMTGLAGMGQEEVPELLFGLTPMKGGTIALFGRKMARPSPHECIRRGLVMLPANRQRYGGVRQASVTHNITLPYLKEYFRSAWLNVGQEKKDSMAIVTAFDVRPKEPDALFGRLSGGNQQKALLGKWLRRGRVLILHEPTHGVDVEARHEISRTIRSSVGAGAAVIVVSNEYDDLATLCDRVMVFRHGGCESELRGGDLTEGRILAACLASAQTSTEDGENDSTGG